MAGFQVITYGRFWVFAEESPGTVRAELGSTRTGVRLTENPFLTTEKCPFSDLEEASKRLCARRELRQVALRYSR